MQKEFYYLKIKTKIKYREIKDFGLNPYLTFLISIVALFYFLNNISASKYEDYISYGLFVFLQFSIVAHRDSEILSINFKNKYLIKLIEISLIALPFITVDLFYKDFTPISIYLSSVILFPFLNFKYKLSVLNKVDLSFLMPNYEWIYGIRKYILFILITTGIMLLGVIVDNANIYLFGLIALFVIIAQFYALIEKEEMLWNYSMSPEKLIRKKIFSVTKNIFFLLSFHMVIFNIFFSIAYIELLTIGISLLILVINQILSKYSSFDKKITIALNQGTTFVIGLLGCFFPMLIIINLFYFFYLRHTSINTLNRLFYVDNK